MPDHGPGQCVMVLFGASGDLAKRLLMPALYNLACDGLLPKRFALVGVAMDELTTDQFRANLSTNIRQFSTRKQCDDKVRIAFVHPLSYTPRASEDETTPARIAAHTTH